MTITVQCPTCSAPVEWKAENTYRPFCCERCKLIDASRSVDEVAQAAWSFVASLLASAEAHG